MRWSLALLVVSSAGCTTAWIDAFRAQQQSAEAYRPSAAAAQDRPGDPAPKKLLVRVWADADYRAATVSWRATFMIQLDRVNELLRRYGVEMMITSLGEWERRSAVSLADDLAALEAHDRAAGVDLVIGLISASPVLTTSVHHLGYAHVLGRHCVVRGMDDAMERDALLRSYMMVSRDKLEEIYRERKHHKEAAVIIHEWGHTLGAVHGSESDDYMHPAYSTRQVGFSFENGELVRAALANIDRRDAARALLKVLDAREKRRPLSADEGELATVLRQHAAAAAAASLPADTETEVAPLQVITAEQGEKCHMKSMRRIKPKPNDKALAELQPLATKLGADSAVLERQGDYLMATLLRCR